MLISVVTTLYRSSAYIEPFYRRVLAAAADLDAEVELIFVDDGSPDDSLRIAGGLLNRPTPLTIVELSRNYGHHRAILKGLEYARGDLVFLIDSDLEEPPELLAAMHRRLEESRASGEPADVVYALPRRRKGGLFERLSGNLFYRAFNLLSNLRVPNDWMIARLMTARYVRAVLAHHEREVFLGGLFCLAGFRQIGIVADKIDKGSTTWTLVKKLRVAVQALVTASARPLWLLAGAGAVVGVLSAAAILVLLVHGAASGELFQSGWLIAAAMIAFFGGLNVLAIGVVGLYVGQVLSEVKARPCIVKEVRSNFAHALDPKSEPDFALEGARHA